MLLHQIQALPAQALPARALPAQILPAIHLRRLLATTGVPNSDTLFVPRFEREAHAMHVILK